MPAWKPAYLVHGDDHGRVAERRAAFRAAAEAESGAGGLELLEGDAATPDAAAAALDAMTFALGRRFVVIDSVQDWKEGDVKERLAAALGAIPPDTTIAFFAREDGRHKAPAALHKAVAKAGGDVIAHETLKARDLPRWAIEEARRLGVELEPGAAKLLVTQVGERQQRLLRELEKLALEHGQGTKLGVEEVQGAAASSAEQQIWGLVDELVAGNPAAAVQAYLELREQGEAIARLLPAMARRVRELLAIALRLEAGESPAQVKASMKGPTWMVDRRIKEARAADSETLRTTLEALARLELETRGHGEWCDLADDTVAVRTLAAVGRG